MYFTNLNMFLLVFLIHSSTHLVVHSYSFCPKCVHFLEGINEISDIHSQVNPRCNLFKSHPLFKDRIDVNFIGKEICTIKGKYFIPQNETILDKSTIFK